MSVGCKIREALGNQIKADAYKGNYIKYNTIIIPIELYRKFKKELHEVSLCIGDEYIGMHLVPAPVPNIGFAELDWNGTTKDIAK